MYRPKSKQRQYQEYENRLEIIAEKTVRNHIRALGFHDLKKHTLSREEYEIRREDTLVTQAGLMMAVFSFSTTALFTVWQVGLQYISRVPEWIMHLGIGIITSFLLVSILFSVLALFRPKRDFEHGNILADVGAIAKSNRNKAIMIKLSIIFFIVALSLVFIEATLIATIYYLCI